jgi:hypothetical protein
MKVTKIAEGKMKKQGADYIVEEPYCVSLICGGAKKKVTVPVGYSSNGSNCSPDIGFGWLFHDWLYYRHCFDDGSECTKIQADNVLEKVSIFIGDSVYGKIAGTVLKLDPFGLATDAWK